MIFVAENENILGQLVWNEIKDKVKKGLIIGLSGDLGVGKTALVKQIAKHLKITDKVTSPTFNIRKSYRIKSQPSFLLSHIDLYRLEKPKLNDLREIEDWLKEEKCLTFIEWVNYAPQIEKYLDLIIKIKVIDKNVRKVELKWL